MIRPLLFFSLRKQSLHTARNYKKTVTDLTKLTTVEVRNWIDSFDTIITDCDGVLWHRHSIIEGSNDVINQLKRSGKQVFFATNNSTKTREELAQKSIKLGFNMEKEGIVATTHISAKYLANMNFKKKCYVIGSIGLGKELTEAGIEHIGIGPDPMVTTYEQLVTTGFTMDPSVGAVIVAFDEHISLPKIVKAASYLNQPSCLFIATNTDESGPLPNGGIVPGAGCMVRSVETVCGRAPLIMGKPNPIFCHDLMRKHKIVPERTVMIGDRGNTDILFGTICGFQTLMVGSGIHSLKDVDGWRSSGKDDDMKMVPDVYLPKLGDLIPFLL